MYDLREMDRCLQAEVSAYLDASAQHSSLLFEAAGGILMCMLVIKLTRSFLIHAIAWLAIAAAIVTATWVELAHDRALDRILECT